MATLLDANGQPIERAVLTEPQTSRVAMLQQQWIQGQASGITPARAAHILREADNGDLLAQHQLFDDMMDRDSHLAGEFGKRTGALLGLDWSIEPPSSPSLQERKAAAWCEEILRDVVDDLEDMLTAMMEGVGHGFSFIEQEWRQLGSERIPVWNPRPQTWFQLDHSRRELRLRDGSGDGAELWPFGWVRHQPGKVKTGYLGRAGLLRPLIWPWMYRAYALSDFAEYLETYGLPFIVGKYFSSATQEEKSSLMRAVTALGHDARAIMPQDMALEIQKITGGGDSTPHLAMMEWAEKAISKLILGATLTTQADGKTSTNALGNVHNDVRHDILHADVRQVEATLTRDVIYPMIAINRGNVDGLRRCPRIRFDTGEAEDLKTYADSLPVLAQNGARIPLSWVHEKLRIPEAADDEPIFGAVAAPTPPVPPTDQAATGAAALNQQIQTTAVTEDPTPVTQLTDTMASQTKPAMAVLMAQVTNLVDSATSLEGLRDSLLRAYADLPSDELRAVMSAGFAVADLSGRFDVSRGE
jgi:phage gp29-like protein